MVKKYSPGGVVTTLTDEEAEAARKAAMPLPASSGPAPTPTLKRPTDFRVSKDSLIRALVSLGKYDAFAAALAAAPQYARDLWPLEPQFRTTDPLIRQFIPAVKQAVGLTDAELDELFWSCRAG